jgi:hypothetical protein
MPSAEVSTDTVAVVHPETDDGRKRMRHRRLMSWLTTALLAAVIGSAVLDGVDVVDVWGVDTATVEAAGPERTFLRVRHPTVTRPALASPFEIVVEREGGFDNDIELAVDLAYLQLWDLNAMFPAPSSERSDDRRVIWTFDAPDGDVFRFVYEARIEPGVQLARQRGAVSFLEGGEVSLTVRFLTKVRP